MLMKLNYNNVNEDITKQLVSNLFYVEASEL
jgi:hypothetical protein